MTAAALVCFTVLSLNLYLHFGLGMEEILSRERSPSFYLCYPWLILFAGVVLLWVFFACIFNFLGGILDDLLIFPLAVLGTQGLEELLFYVFPGRDRGDRLFKPGSAYNGLAAAALALTNHFAFSFGEALLVSFAFSLGGLGTFLIVREIRKRLSLETVPGGLRGRPVLLISMGLLALVFSGASVLFLEIFL